tara:strand:+ start:6773 stop:7030 length:258 start_codon:yes stop_codon:yes gene_type:complete
MSVYVVTDANYGALVFTTRKGALDYVFQDRKFIPGYSFSDDGKGYWRKSAERMLSQGYQVSGHSDRLGDFTITQSEIIKRGQVVE